MSSRAALLLLPFLIVLHMLGERVADLSWATAMQVMPDQHFDELVDNFSDGAGGFLYKNFMAWVRKDF